MTDLINPEDDHIEDVEAEILSSTLKRSLRERLAKALGLNLLGAKLDERGAKNDRKAAESRLKGAQSQQDASVLKGIQDFFHDNTAFSRDDFNAAKL